MINALRKMMNEFRKTGMDACCTLVCSLFQPTIHLDEREGVGHGTKLPAPVRYAGVQEKAVVRIDL